MQNLSTMCYSLSDFVFSFQSKTTGCLIQIFIKLFSFWSLQSECLYVDAQSQYSNKESNEISEYFHGVTIHFPDFIIWYITLAK
jgi:hypothetical protein